MGHLDAHKIVSALAVRNQKKIDTGKGAVKRICLTVRGRKTRQ